MEIYTEYNTLQFGPAVMYRYETDEGGVFETVVVGTLEEARRYRDGWLRDYGHEPAAREVGKDE